MRVIAGKFRGRTLRSLEGQETRPTYDRLKETLFNVLQAAGSIEGASFLDLFAGTGSIGIEALSRGAARVEFVESSRKAANVIRANLGAMGLSEETVVHERTAVDALARLTKEDAQFDVCFLDPPYQLHGAYEQVLRIMAESSLLSERGILIAEHDKRFDPGNGTNSLVRYRVLKQGESCLSFYRKSVIAEGAEEREGTR